MAYRDRREWSKKYYALNQACKCGARRNACKRNRRRMQGIKASTPCKDCGEYFPHYVMEFDHFRKKEYDVSRMTPRGWDVIEAELKKCHVVCANCHRIKNPSQEETCKKNIAAVGSKIASAVWRVLRGIKLT